MINDKVRTYLLSNLFNAAVRAGAIIMKVHNNLGDYEMESPDSRAAIESANLLAHQIIKEYLGKTRIPILSEEGREMRYEERQNWELFWMVDPLDGTVEFAKGNNEFTVNIALMENNICQGAVIYMPYFGKMYIAARNWGSFVKERVLPDLNADYDYDNVVAGMMRLPLLTHAHDVQRVAVSRLHQTPETLAHIDELRRRCQHMEVIEQGSSYKFCLLAEGAIDYYVRTSATYEWDTAAGELILTEAGGRVNSLPVGDVLRYNKDDLANPWFVCRSKFCTL
ncbi:MAG: 3'(2'),5'-bisphosphate nucleotidase CysQ [Alistipes sp.]